MADAYRFVRRENRKHIAYCRVARDVQRRKIGPTIFN